MVYKSPGDFNFVGKPENYRVGGLPCFEKDAL